MYLRVNLKMKKPTSCYCFIWIAFIELNFTVAFLLISQTWDGRFVGNIACNTNLSAGGGRLSLLPNFQKGALDRISIFRGRLLGKGGDLFRGGFSFYIKNKLKSGIFNGIFFSVITRNLN